MTAWPNTIPDDLDRMLAQLEELRHHKSNQDRWGVIKEWLERHGVEAPDSLPERAELASRIGHGRFGEG